MVLDMLTQLSNLWGEIQIPAFQIVDWCWSFTGGTTGTPLVVMTVSDTFVATFMPGQVANSHSSSSFSFFDSTA